MENTQPEPSMEEILASIRRIISEDEGEIEAESQAPVASQPPPSQPSEEKVEFAESEAVDEEHSIEDLEPSDTGLTSSEGVESQDNSSDDVAEMHQEMEDDEMVNKMTAAVTADENESLLDEITAAAATQAFDSLSQNIQVSKGDGRTLEDMVAQFLQPMLKTWLDDNLPAIVEDKVEEEVQRLARRRR